MSTEVGYKKGMKCQTNPILFSDISCISQSAAYQSHTHFFHSSSKHGLILPFQRSISCRPPTNLFSFEIEDECKDDEKIFNCDHLAKCLIHVLFGGRKIRRTSGNLEVHVWLDYLHLLLQRLGSNQRRIEITYTQ